MRIHSYIFHYNRPQFLYANASELARIGNVTVVDDRSEFDVKGYPVLVMSMHGGKDAFDAMWARAIADAKTSNADVFIFSPDDVGNWDLTALLTLVGALEGTHSPWAINFLRDNRDVNWNTLTPKEANIISQVPTQRVYFCDCALIVPRHTLALMNWNVPTGLRKKYNLESSGVGRWLTDKLNELNVPIYRPQRSFAEHLGNAHSVMHPILRLKEPITTLHDAKPMVIQVEKPNARPITANIATYWSREECLKRMLVSIEGQFDKIRICLNGYQVVPQWLQSYADTHSIFIQIPSEDLADNGKFLWLDGDGLEEDYYMLDDDLLYPADFVQKTQPYLRERSIVTYHGRNINPKADSYYSSKHHSYSCIRKVAVDTYVHVGGTGVMAIDTSVFRPQGLAYYSSKYMADLVFAHAAALAGKRILVLAHSGEWINIVTPHPEETIFTRFKNNDAPQWELAKKILSTINSAYKLPTSLLVNDEKALLHTVVLSCDNKMKLFALTGELSKVGHVSIADNASGFRMIKYPFESPENKFSLKEWQKWYQMAFNLAQMKPAAAYAFLQDTISWNTDALLEAIQQMPPDGAWALIPVNSGRAFLWRQFTPSPATFNASFEAINFVDEAFILNHKAMELIQWTCPEVPPFYFKNSNRSGIGYYMSEKLTQLNIAIYRPAKSLITP